jgi:sterol desaturase/sphingolipid hydroxylase (fatty acid hydroxylase superfamily)
MFLVATMVTEEWMNHRIYALIMMIIPIPLLLFAERIWTKLKDWTLEPGELAEDACWLAMGGLLWGPLISGLYRTPVSEGFKAVRDIAPLNITMDPQTIFGLVGGLLLMRISSGFIYYWLHRVQHETLFWWRTHATHHDITKMSCMRGGRTHPLEYLALGLGTPIMLALLGAGDNVLIVSAAFGMWNGKLNHSNLPLTSMPVYDWLFATAPQHHCHHALERRQADSNYGCNVILWDRVFGTYCGDTEIKQLGAGKGVALSIKEPLALAFYSDKRLKSL